MAEVGLEAYGVVTGIRADTTAGAGKQTLEGSFFTSDAGAWTPYGRGSEMMDIRRRSENKLEPTDKH